MDQKPKKLSSRGWLVMAAGTVLLLALLLAGFNFAVDPYGAFGDPLLQWWSYDETMNPRMAKISYLERHHEEYDSYLVGSSGTSSYPIEALNSYLDARFYNCFFYGSETKGFEEMAAYLLQHYEVRNLVLNLSPYAAATGPLEEPDFTNRQHWRVSGENPVTFYSRYLFNDPADAWNKLQSLWHDGFLQTGYKVFDPDTGAYDKSRRDAEPIHDLESYLAAYPAFSGYTAPSRTLVSLDELCAAVSRIRSLCAEKGARLLVLLQPGYCEGVAAFSPEDQAAFRKALASVTGYWDLTLSSVSYEPRYFYDTSHFRNSVGEMALARVFGDGSVYCPADLGEYVPQGADPGPWQADPLPESAYTAEIPILMYHNLVEESEESGGSVSAARFREQMEALYQGGYTPISLSQLLSYVNSTGELPESPVLLSFDDGYRSNLAIAAPILEEYGFPAAIFAIGVSMGKDVYKDGQPMTPHFSRTEARALEADGLVTVQSHGYDLHEVEGRDEEPIRPGALPREGESEEDYVNYLRADCARMRQLLGEELFAFSYPYGMAQELTEVVLSQEGMRITLLTGNGRSTVVRGLPQSLRQLKRYSVNNGMGGDALLALLKEE